MTRRTIKVDYLARVEGEGALHVRIKDRQVESVQLKIFEPPRFFEAFLRGRDYRETPDIVARICGICPVAYQMSAVHALENALGVQVSEPVRQLRRLLYCGEWIESHVLHIYMLHAPDFLGYQGAIEMARDHRTLVERGLKLKQAGNVILQVLGGREIHPINVKVGGFYKVPGRNEMRALKPMLEQARDAAVDTVHWVAGFEYPEIDRGYEFVALRADVGYPMNEGRITSSAGLSIDAADFDSCFEESHVQHSTALHAAIKGRGPYLVGPLARFNLNHDRLSPIARRLAHEMSLSAPVRNPFKSIIVRALEVLHACELALDIVDQDEPFDPPAQESSPRSATGHACTEAPRGILYHRYQIDADGTLLDARIVPPTSQNQATIEDDLRAVVEHDIDIPDSALRDRCEQSIRNHDPCISCATHFLQLDVERH